MLDEPIECSYEEDRIELGACASFAEMTQAKAIFVAKYNAQDSEISFRITGCCDHETISLEFFRVILNKNYQAEKLAYDAHQTALEQERERERKVAAERQKVREDFKNQKRLERIEARKLRPLGFK